ncbi:MAG: putative lipid II flippase FtsW [Candidatus Shapirobacteria bacterium]|nr:putative lipid II flippase FtsW [Candidatus Shapirobacteria bacterium]MDD5073963.1 putative lipid II flippase FtsW [Candidatus Shapirobacteria bacterium]MDD5481671.1 putative lipid II flippase FtsW [Candidatus Shapirobacteria bacterium]
MSWLKTTKKTNQKKSPDWLIFVLTLLLVFLGLLIIADASAVVAQIDFGDQFYYLKKQAFWLLAGLSLMIIASLIDYRKLKPFAFWFLALVIIFLVLVLIPGLGEKRLGAQRWLGIGGFGFQPSELAKLALIIWGASFFDNLLIPVKKRVATINEKITSRQNNSKPIWPFLLVLVFLAFLIMLEPDLGTTIVIVATGFCLAFFAETPAWKIAAFSLLGLGAGLLLIVSSPYRQERLLTFFNPNRDPQGASYHTQQILIALGSGGLFGQGIGQGRQKYAYLPEVVTDSIFAVVGEELGFLGAATLVILLAALSLACLKLSLQAPDRFGQLICAGIGTLIGIQTIINLGAIVGIFPLTGIPLPLISYGGSSLVVCLVGLGLVLSVSRCRIEERR